jgi:integrase
MSLYRRGSVWWYEFNFQGQRIRESAHTTGKTIARQAELQRRHELELGVNRISQPKRMPLLKVAAARLLEDKRARRAKNTSELYRFALKPIIEEFGSRLVSDITPEHIAAYQAKRLREGKATRTVNLEVGALRATLKTYRLWGAIADGVEMLRERRDVGKAISREDEVKLLDAIQQSRSPALLPLFVLTLDSGLRAVEIRSLRRRDLAVTWSGGIIESGMITVPKSKTEAGTGRTIPLTGGACAALSLWFSRFPDAGPDTFVFPRHLVGVLGNKRMPHFNSVGPSANG